MKVSERMHMHHGLTPEQKSALHGKYEQWNNANDMFDKVDRFGEVF